MSGDLDHRLDRGEVARLLAQRSELGAHEWVLESVSGGEAFATVRGARARDAAEGAGRGDQSGSGAPFVLESAASGVAASGVAASARPAGSADLPFDYQELRDLALGCTRCALAEERTQVVFADGNPDARLMVVGEAPGANEDATGLPFVGAAGKLLDLLLAAVGFSREDTVYIANLIKCRPPGNRNPEPAEIEACAPYLRRQIELVKPEALLAVGTFAGRLLSGKDLPLGKLRGEVYAYQGTPLVVTYHPAALLRNSGWTEATWDDLQLLRQVMDGG